MPNLLGQLQRQMGRALKLFHRTLGFTITYVNYNDRTADPFTSVTLNAIPMAPTALVIGRGTVGGRIRDIPQGGGLFSLEQQPFFVISREALKVGSGVTDSTGAAVAEGTFLTPNVDDKFNRTGEADVFRIEMVIELAPETPGWVLAYNRIFREGATG